MNTIALKLLSLAYECYLKTSGKDFRFTPSNSNDYIQTINAVEYLEENGYILMLSNNVDADVIKLVEKGQIIDEATFYFELTDKGLEYCRINFKH